jgi:hypothetical protein
MSTQKLVTEAIELLARRGIRVKPSDGAIIDIILDAHRHKATPTSIADAYERDQRERASET